MNLYRPVRLIDKKYWPKWYKAVIKYIEDNYTRRLYLDDIARISGFSKCHFCRVFKIVADKTVIEYVNHMRIEKAKELLKNPYIKITDICFEVGFSDVSTFNLFFKNGKGYAVAQEDGFPFVKRYAIELQEYKNNKWVKSKLKLY